MTSSGIKKKEKKRYEDEEREEELTDPNLGDFYVWVSNQDAEAEQELSIVTQLP